MPPRSRSGLGVMALAWACAAPSCYAAWSVGANRPLGRAQSETGGYAAMDVGLVFDYRRFVRVAYARSFQMFGGGALTVDGQGVIVPLPNVIELQATVQHWPEQVYLRATARGYWGSNVRVGPRGQETVEPGSSAYGGMLGATILFAGDHEGVGPAGLSLTAGVLVGRADTESLGRVPFVTPMLMLGADFFPPLLFYCWFVDEKCPHHLTL